MLPPAVSNSEKSACHSRLRRIGGQSNASRRTPAASRIRRCRWSAGTGRCGPRPGTSWNPTPAPRRCRRCRRAPVRRARGAPPLPGCRQRVGVHLDAVLGRRSPRALRRGDCGPRPIPGRPGNAGQLVEPRGHHVGPGPFCFEALRAECSAHPYFQSRKSMWASPNALFNSSISPANCCSQLEGPDGRRHPAPAGHRQRTGHAISRSTPPRRTPAEQPSRSRSRHAARRTRSGPLLHELRQRIARQRSPSDQHQTMTCLRNPDTRQR